ncbi:5'-methylthioadenosine/adenosylhomocysteine nucleosidase [Cecembia rubra]|uniref:adenosylhomocysteine nucleosidase n=1 Tax=Cecembia rubra TaxID=1485585 RepID=A0A2P8E2T6_9BACT|nr:5'-methylthioadenosine/adenosylhomocysteine nucleosidase [Cecembia rubra]PSL03791.1 adenosylhomocysteine nucleosidase [Cecembia rubra]
MKKALLLYFFLILQLSAQAQKIAIMGALDQEIAILLDQMKKQKKVNKGGIDFFTGKLQGKKVVVLKAGVGKVNASYSTAVLTQNFKIESLIFTGVAGGLHPESLPGDLVIGEKLIQHDFGKFDSTGFSVTPYRKLTGGHLENLYVDADKKLLIKCLMAAGKVDFGPIAERHPKVFSGVIATGDMFVSSNEKAFWLYEEFEALATEMEGAAVGHLCQTLNIPFIVIRSLSDNANNNARIDFNQFVEPASINSAKLVLAILEEMGN